MTVDIKRRGTGGPAVLPGALSVLLATLRDGPLPEAPSEALLDALMRAVQKEEGSSSFISFGVANEGVKRQLKGLDGSRIQTYVYIYIYILVYIYY